MTQIFNVIIYTNKLFIVYLKFYSNGIACALPDAPQIGLNLCTVAKVESCRSRQNSDFVHDAGQVSDNPVLFPYSGNGAWGQGCRAGSAEKSTGCS